MPYSTARGRELEISRLGPLLTHVNVNKNQRAFKGPGYFTLQTNSSHLARNSATVTIVLYGGSGRRTQCRTLMLMSGGGGGRVRLPKEAAAMAATFSLGASDCIDTTPCSCPAPAVPHGLLRRRVYRDDASASARCGCVARVSSAEGPPRHPSVAWSPRLSSVAWGS